MLRTMAVVGTALVVSVTKSGPAAADRVAIAAPIDVAAIITAARGANPLICSLAAQSLRNYGWNSNDAPASPLGPVISGTGRDNSITRLPDPDVDRLLESLASDDACVRELSVRLIGHQTGTRVVGALTERLASPDASLRSIAALGLGLIEPKTVVEPLLRTLRDDDAGVRANSAWALGRIEDGRALAPVIGLFGDADIRVREAAVVAAGQLDSTSAVAALMRVVQNDAEPRVRRSAAWALGQLKSRESANVLAGVLSKDSDARVREMAAWAIGDMHARGDASGALTTALQRDADDAVREMAAWALAESGDRNAITALGEAAGGDRSARVRGTAAWGVGELHRSGMPVPSGLVKALRDESDDTRLKAAWALGQAGDQSAVGEIRDALKREQIPRVRTALVRALIKSGGRSEAALTELLESSDASVRDAAVRGLAGGNSFNPWPWPQPRPRPFP